MCAGLSHVWLFVTPWTRAYQAPLSMEFSRQEFGSGWHFLLQGVFLTQGSNPCLLCLLHWQVDSLPLIHLGSPFVCLVLCIHTHIHTHTLLHMVSRLIAQTVKSLPLVQVTWVQSLGLWDPLEKEWLLTWRILWTEEPDRLWQSMGSQRVWHNWATKLTFTYIHTYINTYIVIYALYTFT